MKAIWALLSVLCMILAVGGPALADSDTADSDTFFEDNTFVDIAINPDIVVNRPVNIQGLTGLIVTNSAYTQPKNKFTIGLSGMLENSNVPNYSVGEGILTGTYGVTDTIEVGFKGRTVATNLGSSKNREIGAGDTDLLFKWRLSSQGEDLPAIAVGAALTLPTGDQSKGFHEVKHEGVRLMLIGTHEKEMPEEDIVIGFYVEGQVVLNDQLEGRLNNPYRDKYGVINAGILVPITEGRQVQVIVEYNYVTRKDVLTPEGGNFSAVTPGLRFVTPSLNITAGVQFLTKDLPGFENDQRYIGTLSYQF
ncbi:MAG: hypothetical protein M0Z89_03440 [Nitrospiraceae bacterium]|nr:hypothetical protein [Nitrospiraceae bacterium]